LKFEFQNDEAAAACNKKKFYILAAACNKKKVIYLFDKSESQKSQKVIKSEKVIKS
jgi:c-di-AMP phosphodiesterase-like protein